MFRKLQYMTLSIWGNDIGLFVMKNRAPHKLKLCYNFVVVVVGVVRWKSACLMFVWFVIFNIVIWSEYLRADGWNTVCLYNIESLFSYFIFFCIVTFRARQSLTKQNIIINKIEPTNQQNGKNKYNKKVIRDTQMCPFVHCSHQIYKWSLDHLYKTYNDLKNYKFKMNPYSKSCKHFF